MKGIILAGGSATRFYPATLVTSKQLLPVYDKPMVYYPLSTLLLAGIRDILLISSPTDLPRFEALLGDGSRLGIKISYAVQPRPEGLAQALIIGRDFLDGGPCALILGDNLFYGDGLPALLTAAAEKKSGATIFAYRVMDPERYGVVAFDERGNAVSIEEKPKHPRSNWAVTGMYFFDRDAPAIASALKPSARNELEITDLNLEYLRRGCLQVKTLGRGFAWLDTGSPEGLAEASEFVRTLQKRQGMQIACPEEIAFSRGFLSREELTRYADRLGAGEYARYLRGLASREAEPA